MMGAVLQRLLPLPVTDVQLHDVYAVDRPVHPDRPWIALCMVASLDGSTVVEGRSNGLSNAHDNAIVLMLRDLADVILVGAGTVRAERYGPPKRKGQRIAVVTNSGRIDPNSTLFTSGAGVLVMPESAPPTRIDTIRAGATTVDLGLAIKLLHDMLGGIRFVHAEGGPRLNGSLVAADLIDELNLTLSPLVTGGDGPRLTVGGADVAANYQLEHVVIDEESFLFTR